MLRAAKANKYGKITFIILLNKIVITAAIGSTTPDNTPFKKAILFDVPVVLYGRDTAIPSGKFCIAIPIAKVNADIIPTP